MKRLPPFLPALAGLGAAILFFILSQAAASGKNAVYDEPVHLLSGYRLLTLRDYDFNHEHPPLMKGLAAAPIVLSGAARPEEPWNLKRERDQWPLSHRWLHRTNDADRILSLGRMPVAVLGALLALLVCLAAWSALDGQSARATGQGQLSAGRRLAAAGIAAGLLALEPNILAHGSLVTTDLGMTLFFFATVISFWRFLETRASGWLAATGILWGLGLLAKFSAMVLLAILPAMALLAAWSGGRRLSHGEGRSRPGRRRRRAAAGEQGEEAGEKGSPLARLLSLPGRPVPWATGRLGNGWSLLLSLAVAGLVALVVLNAGYGFDRSFSSLSQMKLESETFRQWAQGSIGNLPLPVPAPFVAGFDHAEAGGQRWWSFLMGRYSMTGWWHYYLVALLVKTSIPLLVLSVSGLVLALRRKLMDRTRLLLLAGPPILLVAAFTISGNLKNIGLRYVLPVYPFLCLFGGVGAVAVARSWRRWGPAAAALLLVWVVAAEAFVYPHHLTYFNELAGGPRGGRWWLLDSNLDWGQDLKGLAVWMRANKVGSIYLDYFGRGSPRYYGVRTEREFRGGWIAVSATNLAAVYRDDKDRYDFLEDAEPETIIGNSIYVYNVPRPAGWKPLPGRRIE